MRPSAWWSRCGWACRKRSSRWLQMCWKRRPGGLQSRIRKVWGRCLGLLKNGSTISRTKLRRCAPGSGCAVVQSFRPRSTSCSSRTRGFTEQANNLASALRGSSKAQGAWGELVLERILEAAGLRRGHEYETQLNYTGESGRRSQPDVVIHLPGERHLVIDSKVSLIHYEAHSAAENDAADRALAADNHIVSVRTHIRSLADRNYQTLYGLNSLDFVIMFLPIRALRSCLPSHGDDKLWEQAWQRNVLLVSPQHPVVCSAHRRVPVASGAAEAQRGRDRSKRCGFVQQAGRHLWQISAR